MSHTIERDEFSKYAPRWLREGTTKPGDALTLPPVQRLPKLRSDEPPWHGPSPFEGDVRPWRTGEMPEQAIVTTVPSFATSSARTGVVERLFWTAAILSVAVSAAGAVGVLLFPHTSKNDVQTDNSSAVSAASSQVAMVSQREKSPITKSTARLGTSDADPAELTPATEGARGAAEAKPAAQAANAVYAVATAAVATPEGLISQQTRSQPQVQTGSSPVPLQARGRRGLSADEIGRLTHRGEAYLAQGDVAAARVLLLRAAEARDARAALALGSTYDPNVLKRMGVVGIQPDPDQAHAWYERAAEFGSEEASQRLIALAASH
jgi:hypothetical protein